MKTVVVAFAFLSVCSFALAETPPPREAVESAVKQMLKTWESNDANQFAEAFDEKALFSYPGDRLNKLQLIELFKDYHAAKKDIKIYFGGCVVEGNRFAIAYQFAATDQVSGARQAVGTAASGELAHGKIVVYKEFYDEHIAPRQAAKEIPLDEGKVSPFPFSLMLDPKLVN